MSAFLNEIPKVGQMVYVRQRPALVRDVKEYNNQICGSSHVVEVEYIDGWSYPQSDSLVWDREIDTKIIKGNLLPKIDDANYPPDEPLVLQSFLDAYRWTSVNRIIKDKSKDDDINLIAPWRSAVQIEDYQLYPVLKSLLMPRITLLLADDVGLGKTVEAGLILSEMYARSRVKRTLVICPASLQVQWKEELKEKFYLDFEIIDRESTFKLQRNLGIDSNPWATFPRIITSMDYLRQPDILQSFKKANDTITGKNESVLPWQMLIVDEAHNLSPSGHSDNSDRYYMLRDISLYFEHRLFLTATPHNGYTHCFTGLLQLLDPVRFKQKGSLDDYDHSQIQLVMVRRLKSELNKLGYQKRFAQRYIKALDIPVIGIEKELFDALHEYRDSGLVLLGNQGEKEKLIGDFLFKLLIKRLLSSSYAFARTWWQHVEGLNIDIPEIEEIEFAQKRAEISLNDEDEMNQREDDVVRKSGAWLNQYGKQLKTHIEKVSNILNKMGLDVETIKKGIDKFPHDTKWQCLTGWINDNLMKDGRLKSDERLIIFTEYKDTLNYLVNRFLKMGLKEPEISTLYGGISSERRQQIKDYFNDPLSSLRILIATDAAAEGINLQNSCRFVFHQDIPWNPMRLEQRNGRVDRHGQYRDVYVYHFTSEDEEDLKFMSKIVKKVEQARVDLGSVGQVIDEAIINYFTDSRVDQYKLDVDIKRLKHENYDNGDMKFTDKGGQHDYTRVLQHLRATEISLGLDNDRLGNLLGNAIRMEKGELEQGDDTTYKIKKLPPSWERLIEDTLEIKNDRVKFLPKIVFDPSYFEKEKEGRRIYETKPDTVLLRLGHPIMQRSISILKRYLWQRQGVTRWTIEESPLPSGIEQVMLFHILLEVSNELRENIHQEVITIPFQAAGTDLIEMEDELWQQVVHLKRNSLEPDKLVKWTNIIKDQWIEIEEQLGSLLKSKEKFYNKEFKNHMKLQLSKEVKDEKQRFDRIIKELKQGKDYKEQERLKREIGKQQESLMQMSFIVDIEAEKRHKLKDLELQLEIVNKNYIYMEKVLEHEKKRMIEKVLPKRFALGNLNVYPLAVEFIVRGDKRGNK